MPLTICPDCGHHPVSDRADACPKCGCLIAEQSQSVDVQVLSPRNSVSRLRESAAAGDLQAMKELATGLWNNAECDEARIVEAIHWAGQFNKNFGRIISADTDHDGHAEMLALLTDIMTVVLNADRFDIMDKITKAMYF